MNQTNINAGAFSQWLNAIRRDQGGDVPCGACNACCRSAYFIHIRADETDSLEHIPRAIRFAAPGRPKGEQVMGFDDQGACPMLQDGKCTVYAHRPQTCRDYDCRIFAACGIRAGGEEKAAVNEQVARWTFEYPNPIDHAEQAAVRAASEFLQAKRALFPNGFIPDNPTQLALLVLTCFECFMSAAQITDTELVDAIVKKMAAHR